MTSDTRLRQSKTLAHDHATTSEITDYSGECKHATRELANKICRVESSNGTFVFRRATIGASLWQTSQKCVLPATYNVSRCSDNLRAIANQSTDWELVRIPQKRRQGHARVQRLARR